MVLDPEGPHMERMEKTTRFDLQGSFLSWFDLQTFQTKAEITVWLLQTEAEHLRKQHHLL